MAADNHKLGQENGQEETVYSGETIDFDFLKTQTFSDVGLERELLELFSAQSGRILSSISTLDPDKQAESAHLLKGSARGIGASQIAELASRYEAADPKVRAALVPALTEAVDAATRAIEQRLRRLQS